MNLQSASLKIFPSSNRADFYDRNSKLPIEDNLVRLSNRGSSIKNFIVNGLRVYQSGAETRMSKGSAVIGGYRFDFNGDSGHQGVDGYSVLNLTGETGQFLVLQIRTKKTVKTFQDSGGEPYSVDFHELVTVDGDTSFLLDNPVGGNFLGLNITTTSVYSTFLDFPQDGVRNEALSTVTDVYDWYLPIAQLAGGVYTSILANDGILESPNRKNLSTLAVDSSDIRMVSKTGSSTFGNAAQDLNTYLDNNISINDKNLSRSDNRNRIIFKTGSVTTGDSASSLLDPLYSGIPTGQPVFVTDRNYLLVGDGGKRPSELSPLQTRTLTSYYEDSTSEGTSKLNPNVTTSSKKLEISSTTVGEEGYGYIKFDDKLLIKSGNSSTILTINSTGETKSVVLANDYSMTINNIRSTNIYAQGDPSDPRIQFDNENNIKLNKNTIVNGTLTGTNISTGTLSVTNNAGTSNISGVINITNNSASSSTTTGALKVTGGVGIGGTLTAANIVTSGNISMTGDLGSSTSSLGKIYTKALYLMV